MDIGIRCGQCNGKLEGYVYSDREMLRYEAMVMVAPHRCGSEEPLMVLPEPVESKGMPVAPVASDVVAPTEWNELLDRVDEGDYGQASERSVSVVMTFDGYGKWSQLLETVYRSVRLLRVSGITPKVFVLLGSDALTLTDLRMEGSVFVEVVDGEKL